MNRRDLFKHVVGAAAAAGVGVPRGMGLTPEQKGQILDVISKALDEPRVEIEWRCGIVRFDGGDGWMHAKPTDGKTLTITINGGARDIEL